MSVLKLRPKEKISYHIDDDKVIGVSIECNQKDKEIYFGLKEDSFNNMSVYTKGSCPSIKVDDFKNLCIAWLALVDPDILKE